MIIGAKYRKLVQDFKTKIDNGDLKPGDKIPSTVELCAEYQVSATVINQAVLVLEAQGYITGRPGLGRFVTEAQ